VARAACEQYIEPPSRLALTPEAIPYLGGLESAEARQLIADEIGYHPERVTP